MVRWSWLDVRLDQNMTGTVLEKRRRKNRKKVLREKLSFVKGLSLIRGSTVRYITLNLFSYFFASVLILSLLLVYILLPLPPPPKKKKWGGGS